MPTYVPIPWLQWKRHRVFGIVREAETGRPLAGLLVSALDKDIWKDDYLGQGETDAEGRFEIRFTDADFKDIGESKPDLYLCVTKAGRDEPLVDTSARVRRNASEEEYFEIDVPRSVLE